ncbi:unnamed protein product, partial [Musa acuminata var. zebrina]
RTFRCCPQIFLSYRISWNRFVAEEKPRPYISWTSSRNGQKLTTHFTRQL